mmetsp:Transcript_19488/g.62109  ORF Transcript_19488/g.62109 Transcript_19488/m.62109 type:complete len:221 (-) Transcript_19488:119-781(-)
MSLTGSARPSRRSSPALGSAPRAMNLPNSPADTCPPPSSSSTSHTSRSSLADSLPGDSLRSFRTMCLNSSKEIRPEPSASTCLKSLNQLRLEGSTANRRSSSRFSSAATLTTISSLAGGPRCGSTASMCVASSGPSSVSPSEPPPLPPSPPPSASSPPSPLAGDASSTSADSAASSPAASTEALRCGAVKETTTLTEAPAASVPIWGATASPESAGGQSS